MTTARAILFLTISLAFARVAGAQPAPVPGGGDAATDCYVGFEVEGTSNMDGASVAGTTVSQLACENVDTGKQECKFAVSWCINEPVKGCTAQVVTKVKETVPPGVRKTFKPANRPPTGGSDHVCGSTPAEVVVKLRGSGTAAKRKTIKTLAKVAGGKDKDTLVLDCQPNPDQTGCGEPVCTAGTLECPANPAGGPSQLNMTVGRGGDLDTGWTGRSHNFPIVVGSPLKYCLTGCNTGSGAGTPNHVCTANGATGAGTLNGRVWGAPLPLVADGVPVCVVNLFRGDISGDFNLETGEFLNGSVPLTSIVNTSPNDSVCPRCVGGTRIGDRGTCDIGPNRGQGCTIDGIITLNSTNPPISNAVYRMSASCPPGGLGYSEVGRLTIDLPLTTSTSSRTGRCGASRDDACGGGTCTESCPPAPPLKGGINQFCCSNDPSSPCFPTRGGGSITRTGLPRIPRPELPDETFPKCFRDQRAAGVFDIPATDSSTVNGIAGLPGCGALIQPHNGVVFR